MADLQLPEPPSLPPSAGVRSLPIALRAEIEKLILRGDLPTGERLNENNLAERFKVSRGPVREACRALVEAGLLEFVPNRGVFVRQISLAEAIATYEVRAGVFAHAGRLAAARVQDSEIARLRSFVQHMDECISRKDGAGYYALNLQFHAQILFTTRNSRLIATYEGLIKELHRFRAKNIDRPEHLRVSNAEHADMVEAIAARDEMRAYEAHYRHVMNAKGRVLEVFDKSNA
jgi:DNA-binding GntR family transcriptional regulator